MKVKSILTETIDHPIFDDMDEEVWEAAMELRDACRRMARHTDSFGWGRKLEDMDPKKALKEVEDLVQQARHLGSVMGIEDD